MSALRDTSKGEGRFEPYTKDEASAPAEAEEIITMPSAAPADTLAAPATEVSSDQADTTAPEAAEEPATGGENAQAAADTTPAPAPAPAATAEAAPAAPASGPAAPASSYPTPYVGAAQQPAGGAYDPKNTMLGKYGLNNPTQQQQQQLPQQQQGGYAQQGYQMGQQQQMPQQGGYGGMQQQQQGGYGGQVTVTPNPQSDVVINGESASCVVHFRNVASSITLQDIQILCSPFAKEPVHIVMMRAKNQALAQFSDIQSSISFVQYYTDSPCQVRGRRVYVKFSRHQFLRQRNNPSKVLLVTLQADYPLVNINIDSIWQLYSGYGFVEKIVIIRKKDDVGNDERENNTRQVLVQYSQQFCAAAAMQALNGQVVLCGDLQLNLTIQYSNLQELIVRQQGPESRDYLELYQQQMMQQQQFGGAAAYGAGMQGMQQGMQGMQQGMPQQGMPQQGMPQQGMPQQGMPQQGMPQQQQPGMGGKW